MYRHGVRTRVPTLESWLSTREGIARHLYRDDLPLVELLHRSGLSDAAKLQVIMRVRAVREAQQRDLLETAAGEIRAAGGRAPDQPYPPVWLMEDQ